MNYQHVMLLDLLTKDEETQERKKETHVICSTRMNQNPFVIKEYSCITWTVVLLLASS